MSVIIGIDERLHPAVVAAYERTRTLALEREARNGTYWPGDLFIVPDLDIGDELLQWAVVLRHTQRPELVYVVPADYFPMSGTPDVGVPDDSPCGPLTLRCGLGFWTHVRLFAGVTRSGVLDEAAIRGAQEILAEMAAGTLDGTPLATATDDDVEYVDHIASLSELVEQVTNRLNPSWRGVAAAMPAIERSAGINPSAGSPIAAPSSGTPSHRGRRPRDPLPERFRPDDRQTLHGSSRKPRSKIAAGHAGTSRGAGAASVVQTYKGYVDAINNGLACLILETESGQRLEIEWDAAELGGKAIGERQPFVLKTESIGNELKYEFIPDRLRPLPEDLQRDISDLLSHYRATGDLDDDDE